MVPKKISFWTTRLNSSHLQIYTKEQSWYLDSDDCDEGEFKNWYVFYLNC